MNKSTVVVVGQGYVGLPLAMGAVSAGFDVVGIDVDERRVKRLVAGDSFIEDISSSELGAALETGRYRASSDWSAAADFDVCVITVPTPLREGVPDLSYVEESGKSVAALLRPGATVVLESTTYPGTTDQILLPILEEGSGLVAGKDFFLGYSPERIDPGNQTWGLANTPKVVSGIDQESLDRVQAFYGAFVGKIVPVSTTCSATASSLQLVCCERRRSTSNASSACTP